MAGTGAVARVGQGRGGPGQGEEGREGDDGEAGPHGTRSYRGGAAYVPAIAWWAASLQ